MDHLLELVKRYPILERVKKNIEDVYSILEHAFACGNKLLIAGNGGSAADAEHIAGELMKSFCLPRNLPYEFIKKIDEARRVVNLKSADLQPADFDYVARNVRGALPVIALTNHNALASACLNDVDGNVIFAQQIYGWGSAGDVFMGISTSGGAKNVLYAAITAKAKGMKVTALSGKTGGALAAIADAAIVVPENETYKIQELHLPIYHALCIMLEERFFK